MGKNQIKINEAYKSKGAYMIGKLSTQIIRVISGYVKSKEDEGVPYTREDILSAIKPATDRLAKMHSAADEKLVMKCLNYFLKKYSKDLNFLTEGKKIGKKVVVNENAIKKIIFESVKRVLKEYNNDYSDFFDDLNNMIDNPMEYFKDNDNYKTQYPEDVYDWGKKVQQLGLELSRLCGKYRFDNGEVYDNLKKIESEYNSVCGDLNTFGIASHWDS